MGNSRSYASITSEEFLSGILGKRDPAGAAAFRAAVFGAKSPISSAEFLAAILGKDNREQRGNEGDRRTSDVPQENWLDLIQFGPADASDPFAVGMAREWQFDPDQPRDWRGRWTADGSGDAGPSDSHDIVKLGPGDTAKVSSHGIIKLGPRDPTHGIRAILVGDPGESPNGSKGKSHEQQVQDILKGLGANEPAPNDPGAGRAGDDSVIFGTRKFTNADGSDSFNGRFVGFNDKGQVLLEKPSKKDGKKIIVSADPKFFSDADKKYLDELGKLRDDKGFMAGIKALPDNFHIDSSGANGDRLAWEAQVIRDIGMLSELDGGRRVLDVAGSQKQPITIAAAKPGDDNHAVANRVYFDPGRTRGAPTQSGSNERPPFIGLGQELYNAAANQFPAAVSLYRREENGLRVGQGLRADYNKTIDDADKLDGLRGRYPGTEKYSGWGSKKADENVLGLDGRPLSRGRDR